MLTRFLWDGMQEKCHLEGVGVAREMILKRNF